MVRLLSFWLQCFQMDFPKPVPRERKKQSRYSSPGTSQWYRSSKCCWCYTHFSTYHLFSVHKIPLFCTWSLCLAQAQTIPELLYWGGEPPIQYIQITKNKQTEFLFIFISVIYSQPGSVMNEQCVWRQIELDTTPVLEQGTNQYFSAAFLLIAIVLYHCTGGSLASMSLYL